MTRVRDYQVETLRAFIDAGFNITEEETLLVKHGQMELAREEKSRPRLARVPTMPALRSQFSHEVHPS
jgi:hypothetical protein